MIYVTMRCVQSIVVSLITMFGIKLGYIFCVLGKLVIFDITVSILISPLGGLFYFVFSLLLGGSALDHGWYLSFYLNREPGCILPSQPLPSCRTEISLPLHFQSLFIKLPAACCSPLPDFKLLVWMSFIFSNCPFGRFNS